MTTQLTYTSGTLGEHDEAFEAALDAARAGDPAPAAD